MQVVHLVHRKKRYRTNISYYWEVLLISRCPSCYRAASGQHGDLGAGVVAIAAHWGLLVLSVGPQKPLQHPPAPLTLNLRLHLQKRWANRMRRGAERRVTHRRRVGGKRFNDIKGRQTSLRAFVWICSPLRLGSSTGRPPRTPVEETR